jgi:hypothetical protein
VPGAKTSPPTSSDRRSFCSVAAHRRRFSRNRAWHAGCSDEEGESGACPGNEAAFSMPTVEERLTTLEGRLHSMSDVRNNITELRGDMHGRFVSADHRFTEVNARITELRTDLNLRFAQVNGRFSELRDDMNLRLGELNARLDAMQNDIGRRFDMMTTDAIHRFAEADHRFGDVDRRFAELDQKLDRHFIWLVGTQVAVLLAVVGAMVGAFYR